MRARAASVAALAALLLLLPRCAMSQQSTPQHLRQLVGADGFSPALRPTEFAALDRDVDCPSGNFVDMPNFYAESEAPNLVHRAEERMYVRRSCVVWPFQRQSVMEPVAFHPSPRAADDRAVKVNGVKFLSASPGVTLWKLTDAHVGRTSEGTMAFTDTMVFPVSHMNPSSELPNFKPVLPYLRRFNIVRAKRAVALGGSLYSRLPQHFVHEGLPLLEVVYDAIMNDPEMMVVVEGSKAIPWLLEALPGLTRDRIVHFIGTPWNGKLVVRAEELLLPDFSFRGCYTLPAGILASSRALKALQASEKRHRPQKQQKQQQQQRNGGTGLLGSWLGGGGSTESESDSDAPNLVLYMQRYRYGPRGIENEEDMVYTIERNLSPGYKLVVLNPMNVTQDRHIAARSKVMLAVHGGSMPINSVFMPRGGHLIELVDLTSTDMRPHCCQPYHAYMAEALDLHFWMQPLYKWSNWTSTVIVDVAALLATLREIGVTKERLQMPAHLAAANPIPDGPPPVEEGIGNRLFGAQTCGTIPLHTGVADGPAPRTPFKLPTDMPLRQPGDWSAI